MRRPDYIARQSRRPFGIVGSLLARVMAVETSKENSFALELMEIQPTEQVLEIGFGHGRTVAHAACAAHRGVVAGIDWSERMLHVPTSYNARLIAQGRVVLRCGSSSRLPYADKRFDRAYSVHTIYFWTKPVEDLREIARVMKPNAILALGFRPKNDKTSKDFPAGTYTHYASGEVERFLENAGFEQVRLEALAKQVLSQLSYTPTVGTTIDFKVFAAFGKLRNTDFALLE